MAGADVAPPRARRWAHTYTTLVAAARFEPLRHQDGSGTSHNNKTGSKATAAARLAQLVCDVSAGPGSFIPLTHYLTIVRAPGLETPASRRPKGLGGGSPGQRRGRRRGRTRPRAPWAGRRGQRAGSAGTCLGQGRISNWPSALINYQGRTAEGQAVLRRHPYPVGLADG